MVGAARGTEPSKQWIRGPLPCPALLHFLFRLCFCLSEYLNPPTRQDRRRHKTLLAALIAEGQRLLCRAHDAGGLPKNLDGIKTDDLDGLVEELRTTQLQWSLWRLHLVHCLPRKRVNATCSAMKTKLVTIDPDIMSGEPVFTGTRVPVRNLIDYLSAGHTLNDFLEGFPGVKRSQAIAFLEQSSSALLEHAGIRRKAA